jgi:hypothetical protein
MDGRKMFPGSGSNLPFFCHQSFCPPEGNGDEFSIQPMLALCQSTLGLGGDCLDGRILFLRT